MDENGTENDHRTGGNRNRCFSRDYAFSILVVFVRCWLIVSLVGYYYAFLQLSVSAAVSLGFLSIDKWGRVVAGTDDVGPRNAGTVSIQVPVVASNIYA